MLTSLHGAIAVCAGVVLLLASGSVASATFNATAPGETITVTTGSVALLAEPVVGFEQELSVDGLRPDESRSFGQRLVHTGTLPADGRVAVTEASGAEDGCTSALELLLDNDCTDTASAGELAEELILRLWVWPAASAACDGPAPGNAAQVGPTPVANLDGQASAAFPLLPGEALCLRGTATLPEDASPEAHGDIVEFSTTGEAREQEVPA